MVLGADNKLVQVDLIERGSEIEVTNENKYDYVDALDQYKMATSFDPMVQALWSGLSHMIPLRAIKQAHLSIHALDKLIADESTINMDDLISSLEYSGTYKVNSDQIVWLHAALRDFSQEQLRFFCSFRHGIRSSAPWGIQEPQKQFSSRAYQNH